MTETTVSIVGGGNIVVGDVITMDLPIYRKWWQFWRPRIIGYDRKPFNVISVSTGTITIDDGKENDDEES